MSLRRRDATPDLEQRLSAVQAAVGAGAGILPEPVAATGLALVTQAGERLGHGLEHTVVALAGATGSGKSSLFNALAGEDLSRVGVTRPTTSTTHACWWGPDASGLLDWLQVPRRHHAAADPDLSGLVLLDLPDHDSTAVEHRREVDRVVRVADVVVWVLDPQKYADRAVHEGYLRPLAHHAGVLLVVLHQADRLGPEQLAACRADLGRLLADEGLEGVSLLTTSVRAEGGTEPLRAALEERVQAHRSAIGRLEADLVAYADVLGDGCGGPTPRSRPHDRRAVTAALADAAGVDAVVRAVSASHRSQAVAATGWPATRWLRRLRPDPLRRLHLGRAVGAGGRTSLPPASAASVARVETTVLGVASEAAAGLPLAWADAVHDEAAARLGTLPARLDASIAATDLGSSRRPVWWRAVGGVQVVLAVVAIIGALWLAALAGLAYLQLSELASPDVGPVPLPTAMLLGGILAGLLLAVLSRILSSIGAQRRARRARARLEEGVAEVARTEVFEPVAGVLDRHVRYCEAVEVAAGRARTT
ncbi:MAG: putative ATP-binding membrane protein [uncultured Acidimicrobiales bacterium]|uniref:Putative ATP-binding membrane protein n=1 Tax=uncultured Acidimicrobiales bacterium TaxID=310071 RepID=A0A6J4I3V8_9ACTN|nr:MAG: putative ATP-binding membrane protein [uncultured Acidimicrobiales bacterium]